MIERTNEDWLEELREPPDPAALEDLRSILLRGLRATLSNRSDIRQADIEDFVQDALLKILGALEGFRGESRFTTWSQKITVRVALTELRRKRWRDWSLDGMLESDQQGNRSDYTPALLADNVAGPEQQAIRQAMMGVVQRTIAEKLTERQRTAMMAVMVHGVPLEEVAERMGANRNALYKLLHDARRKLKRELSASGLSSEEILGAFE